MNRFSKLFLASLVALSFSANAHNIWLEKSSNAQAGEYIVKFGHEQTETYPEKKLTGINAIDQKAQPVALKKAFIDGEMHLQLPDNVAMVFLDFDNGVWSKLPNGRYVEKTKKEAPNAVSAKNPVKVGKAILQWSNDAKKSHGLKYELIPQTQPVAGKPLDILVLVNGKPAKGIQIGVDEEATSATTNANGIAKFTPQMGKNRVWAGFSEKVTNTTNYDIRSIEYLLTFEVK